MNLTSPTLAAVGPAIRFNARTPERPLPAAPSMLLRMLDEIDYGMVLVTVSGTLRYANQLALRCLALPGPLRLSSGELFAPLAADQAQLRSALADAARGLRRLLHLGDGAHAASIAVLPLADDDAADAGANGGGGLRGAAAASPLAMLLFGKRPACETLTVDIFARTQKLTGAEAAVLRGLCSGLRPKQIATGAGVAVSTVRTQINSIRVKTRTSSIRELVDRVAALPPITPAMKSVVCH